MLGRIVCLIKGVLSKKVPVLFTKVLYRHFVGHKLDLANPKALTEKIQWLKLFRYSNNELVKKCIDKYRVRDYIEKQGCGEILNELIDVWDDAASIDWNQLPDKFVLKCTHGCGYNIICKDKNYLDITDSISKLNRWMNEEYGQDYAETIYFGIKPRIMCEKYIEPCKGEELKDYKIFCSYGKPQLIYVITGGHGNNEHLDYYTTDWKWIPVNNGTLPNAGDIVKKPEKLDEMLEYAAKLSKDFPIVRVDLYCEDQRIFFGELTFLPTGGFSNYNPNHYDYEFGKMFDISKEMQIGKKKE